jgi:hypothetical protein
MSFSKPVSHGDRAIPVRPALSPLGLLPRLACGHLSISLIRGDLTSRCRSWSGPLTHSVLSHIALCGAACRAASSTLCVVRHQLFAFAANYHSLLSHGILLLGCVALYRLTVKLDDRTAGRGQSVTLLVALIGQYRCRIVERFVLRTATWRTRPSPSRISAVRGGDS